MFDEIKRSTQEEVLRKMNISPSSLFVLKHQLYRITLTAVTGVLVNDLYNRYVVRPAMNKRTRLYS